MVHYGKEGRLIIIHPLQEFGILTLRVAYLQSLIFKCQVLFNLPMINDRINKKSFISLLFNSLLRTIYFIIEIENDRPLADLSVSRERSRHVQTREFSSRVASKERERDR